MVESLDAKIMTSLQNPLPEKTCVSFKPSRIILGHLRHVFHLVPPHVVIAKTFSVVHACGRVIFVWIGLSKLGI